MNAVTTEPSGRLYETKRGRNTLAKEKKMATKKVKWGNEERER
jgi:hypothetical protein